MNCESKNSHKSIQLKQWTLKFNQKLFIILREVKFFLQSFDDLEAESSVIDDIAFGIAHETDKRWTLQSDI